MTDLELVEGTPAGRREDFEVLVDQVQDLLTAEQQARLVLLRPQLQNQIRQNVERRLQRMRMNQ